MVVCQHDLDTNRLIEHRSILEDDGAMHFPRSSFGVHGIVIANGVVTVFVSRS